MKELTNSRAIQQPNESHLLQHSSKLLSDTNCVEATREPHRSSKVKKNWKEVADKEMLFPIFPKNLPLNRIIVSNVVCAFGCLLSLSFFVARFRILFSPKQRLYRLPHELIIVKL
jgi:hypothetical protein